MSKYYFIYATEYMYQGLHGIENWDLVKLDDNDSYDILYEIGYELSTDLITSYNYRDWYGIDDDADEDECWSIIDENVQYSIYRIKDELIEGHSEDALRFLEWYVESKGIESFIGDCCYKEDKGDA